MKPSNPPYRHPSWRERKFERECMRDEILKWIFWIFVVEAVITAFFHH